MIPCVFFSMCFDVDDCATQAEAHCSRKDAIGGFSAAQRGLDGEYRAAVFPFLEEQQSRLLEPLLHAAKKNHSNFILKNSIEVL
ncbi:MAG TPA: hypothetical protein DDZ37_03885 [Spirochaetaceae bacterium]|nr:hypothetical protein [Spirochaetaceae bacterium]